MILRSVICKAKVILDNAFNISLNKMHSYIMHEANCILHHAQCMHNKTNAYCALWGVILMGRVNLYF